MKIYISLVAITIALLFSIQAVAKDHGFVTSIPGDVPAESVFRVNIEKVDGKEPGLGVNTDVKPGTHNVEVSLVFNAEWGSGMARTEENTYYKSISIEVEAEKTYFLGAKVDTHASAEAQNDGSFWEPIIYQTR